MSSKYVMAYHHPVQNLLICAKYSLTDTEGRIFLELVKRIKFEDTDFREAVFTKAELQEITGTHTRSLSYLKKVLNCFYEKSLLVGKLSFKEKDEETPYLLSRWIGSHSYEDGKFTIVLESALKPYLLELTREFTFLEIEAMIKMTPHARRIYMFAKQYLRFGRRNMKIAHIVDLMELKDTYKEFKYLSRSILKPAQEQINKLSDIELAIMPDKTTRGSDGRYRHVIFDIKTRSGKVAKVRKDNVVVPLNQKILEDGSYIGGKDEKTDWEHGKDSVLV